MIFKPASAVALFVAAPVRAIVTVTNKPSSQPTPKPTFQVWSGTDCPRQWAEGAAYESKDLTTVDGVVYQCSSQG
jgi:hypothetical protein